MNNKSYFLLLISVLAFLFSCNGQTKVAEPSSPVVTVTKDSVTSLSKNIMVIYQDAKHNYWFGSWENGLYKYDGKQLRHFTKEDGLAPTRIDEIKEDSEGNIYINTMQGLYRFDGKTFTQLKETKSITENWQLKPNDLWFKAFHGTRCVYRYDGKGLYKLTLAPHSIEQAYLAKNPNAYNPYDIYTIYKDSKGHIWFGTALFGVARYNGVSIDWISEEDVTELHNGPANGVRGIAEDSGGNFWFNTEYKYKVYAQTPLLQSPPATEKFYQRLPNVSTLDKTLQNQVKEYLAITRDKQQHLWIVTYTNGVWKYDGNKVQHYPVKVNGEDIHLFYIYTDREGKIWLGSHENGVFTFNGQGFEPFIP